MNAGWAALIGGLVASLVSLLNNWFQTRREREKDNRLRNWNLEDKEMSRKYEEFKVLNQVLEADGQERMISYEYDSESSKTFAKFNLVKYRESIRHILFNNLDLLPPKVRNKTRKLDITIFDNTDKVRYEWNNEMSNLYTDLIKEILKNYK
ncbi:hypothetical protein G7L40_20475 [Paenibacillus polymyxa]|uniref:Uncharacterized protein n=1 Tax=Paenibacillus polymyxa TaxID=1406 RepID=A0A378Y069_PAEPO|nr:hypothetical protein [Paenibacillus polymyxa]MBE7896134.1 hypothetical protein [Paenibacillus polymyxa]MBG9765920.1 hypothetical protein [Paenibacillus polymyxa]MCC3256664.1 hypothetical protein [Paenibacillus polymyxa]QPK54845.1 hypothetical protein G7035_20520 [Paenibacillus polymyxa]QPK59935.1 hypothetical protein G7L40_20475 [Paenibacillus polymyxa]